MLGVCLTAMRKNARNNLRLDMALANQAKPRAVAVLPQDTQPRASTPVAEQLSLSDIPFWTSPPISAFGRPEPILPSADEERASYVDHHARASLEPFKYQQADHRRASHPLTPPRDCLLQPQAAATSPLQPPALSGPEGRRNTWAFPDLTPNHSPNDVPVNSLRSSTANQSDGQRRSSAPSAGLPPTFASVPWGISDSEIYVIVPRQLSRPRRPTQLSQGVELWWPAHGNGNVEIQVGIASRMGILEKLTRCFPPRQLQMALSQQPLTPATPHHEEPIPFPPPGSVLPIPGTRPPAPYVQQFLVASSSRPAFPTLPRHGTPAEYHIYKEHAVNYLPVLGAVLLQTKRPIREGERIMLPLPYPHAWSETVRYVSTGDPNFLSESVKSNVLHLGGVLRSQ